ncbi:MAG: hypothetical protein HRU38_19930 [Saccharospirillaceae bacterium]|nr:hypothetical protein [Pseudomonadales bacterium]NRB80903.1 hypothetical protein [Saccharospirillaceae bacterium]
MGTKNNDEDMGFSWDIKAKVLIKHNVFFMVSYENKPIPTAIDTQTNTYNQTIDTNLFVYGIGVRETIKYKNYPDDEYDVFAYYNLISTANLKDDIKSTIAGKNKNFEIGIGMSAIQADKPKEVASVAIVINKYEGFDLQWSNISFVTDFGYHLTPNIQAIYAGSMTFTLEHVKLGLGLKGTF